MLVDKLILGLVTVVGQSSVSINKVASLPVRIDAEKILGDEPNGWVRYHAFLPSNTINNVTVKFRIDVHPTNHTVKAKYVTLIIPAGSNTAADIWRDLNDDTYNVFDIVAY